MATNNLPFKVDYAKSGRSKCKTTKQNIPKGTLRLGIMVKSPHFDGMQPNWHDAHAFFAKTNRRKRPATTEEIDGFDTLRPDDQGKIEDWIAAYSKAAKGKSKKNQQDDNDVDPQSTEPSLKQAVRAQSALVWKIRDLATEETPAALSSGTIRTILKEHDIPLEGFGVTELPGLLAELVVFGVPPIGNTQGGCCGTRPLRFCPHAGKYVCKAPQAWGECTYSQSVDDTVCRPVTAPNCKHAEGWWQAVQTICDPTQPQKRLFLPKSVPVKEVTPMTGKRGADALPPLPAKKGKLKPALSRALVDPDSGLDHDFHVLDEGKAKGEACFDEPFPLDLWDTTLCNTDLSTGINSVYKLQILVPDRPSGNRCYLWRQWGRVGRVAGKAGGGEKLNCFGTIEAAKAEFCALFKKQTGNLWQDRKKFVKKPKLFMQMDVSYSVDGEAKKTAEAPLIKAGTIDPSSKLDPRVQHVISTMFDPAFATTQLEEMNIDLAKMPLGKITEAQLLNAHSVLTEIESVLGNDTLSAGTEKTGKLQQLSNQFFSICPSVSPVLINSSALLKEQIEMVDELLSLHASDEVMNDNGDSKDVAADTPNEALVDAAYEKLKTEFVPLDPKGAQYVMLKQYVENTRTAALPSLHGIASTNDWGHRGLRLLDAFEVNRNGEKELYTPSKRLGNRRLLWHGSPISNYTGILSQGLRIAPPEAPVSGYRFGKGVYFSDMLGKSANYCRTGGSSEMFVMLCDVSLGEMFQASNDTYMEKAQPGTNSTHALSYIVPDPAYSMVLSDNSVTPTAATGVSSLGEASDSVLVPLGQPVVAHHTTPPSCDVSEFIVYNQTQVQIRFLLRLSTDPDAKAADEAVATSDGVARAVTSASTVSGANSVELGSSEHSILPC